MKIALITPAGARSRSGNRHTAMRWAAMLRSLGHRVQVSIRWGGRAADADQNRMSVGLRFGYPISVY